MAAKLMRFGSAIEALHCALHNAGADVTILRVDDRSAKMVGLFGMRLSGPQQQSQLGIYQSARAKCSPRYGDHSRVPG